MFQSTHPRGVRPIRVGVSEDGGHVSIHAPARGATRHPSGGRSTARRFNPRTREGCDWPPLAVASTSWSFNPPTREGCDIPALSISTSSNKFQSTHPRGVRPWRARGHIVRAEVSIHAPARGATSRRGPSRNHTVVSIHAPARGATSNSPSASRTRMKFQSTHPRGVRLRLPRGPGRGVLVSIHAPARGATPLS